MTTLEKSAGLVLAMNELTISKSNAKLLATEILTRCADGRLDLLQTAARLSFLAEVEAAFSGDTTRQAIRAEIEARGAGTGKVLLDAGTFATAITGTKYDYAADEVWRDLAAQEKAVAEKRKAREEFLKAITCTVTQAYQGPNDKAPRTIAVAPPVSTSTEGYRFTMNKG